MEGDDGNGKNNPGRPTKRSRARRTCSSCHLRKTKCDVQQRGTPCSNCVVLEAECVIRTRKNARTRVKSPETVSESASLRSPSGHEPYTAPRTAVNLPISHEHGPFNGTYPLQDYRELEGVPPSIGSDAHFDLGTLADFEDIFSTTYDAYSKNILPDNHYQPFDTVRDSRYLNHTAPYSVSLANTNVVPSQIQILESQRCLELPPPGVLRQILACYFRYVHPNLPLVEEHEVWALWSAESFSLGNFSYLVMRAMIFAAVHFLDQDVLQSQLGFNTKGEARDILYTQAKLVYSFDVESDPIFIAQACLLMTYYSPNRNTMRVNSYWLYNAAHYANIAQASAFTILSKTDPERARVLKRLYWCLAFRDISLSLGLRRPLVVEQPGSIFNEQTFLHVADFIPELGRSEVHERATQLRLIDVGSWMCRLVHCLIPALRQLYRYERFDQRVAEAKRHSPFAGLREAIENLQNWHDGAIQAFPPPLTLDLDDASTGAAVSIFGNVLFVLYDCAMFALQQHRVLLAETSSALDAQISIHHDAVSSMERSMRDVANRMQEVLQARLARFLPMSISAFISLPLILQAINVRAARGHLQETIESRKLEVLTRILENQILNFDGSVYIENILSNIIEHTKSIRLLDDGQASDDSRRSQPSSRHSTGKTAAMWPDLMRKKPRLLLRLLLRLDGALCTGGILGEEDWPQELRSGS